MPANRIFRIVGKYPIKKNDPSETANVSPLSSIYFFDMDWPENSMCVYAGDQFTRIFWNNNIYRPAEHLTNNGKILFEYVDEFSGANVEVPFPTAALETVVTKIRIFDDDNKPQTNIDLGIEFLKLNNTAVVQIYKVDFATINSSGNAVASYKPFYVDYTISQNGGTSIIQLDTEATYTANDYIILTCFTQSKTTTTTTTTNGE